MRVCVYASSSPKTSSAFVAQGRRLGRLLAERGHVLINGGGKFGGMGALNEGCRGAGGVIECVIHEMFVVDEGEFEGSDHLIVCQGDDLGERKRALVERCDVIIVLPGGLGTLDEMLDAAALSQLGMPNARPVVAVNIDGYYDFTLKQLERARQEGLLSKNPADILASVPDVDAALSLVRGARRFRPWKARPSRVPLKWPARGGWVFGVGRRGGVPNGLGRGASGRAACTGGFLGGSANVLSCVSDLLLFRRSDTEAAVCAHCALVTSLFRRHSTRRA